MIKEKKAGLRNFNFLTSADAELVRRAELSGASMTVILEDLLLGRRQFAPEIEAFITKETARTGQTRWTVIESALAAHVGKAAPAKAPPEDAASRAAKAALVRTAELATGAPLPGKMPNDQTPGREPKRKAA